MIDHGSRSPESSRFGLHSQKYDLPPIKQTFPTNFVFIKFLPCHTVGAVDAPQTLFRDPLTLEVRLQR
jgi:hypothetical protein